MQHHELDGASCQQVLDERQVACQLVAVVVEHHVDASRAFIEHSLDDCLRVVSEQESLQLAHGMYRFARTIVCRRKERQIDAVTPERAVQQSGDRIS